MRNGMRNARGRARWILAVLAVAALAAAAQVIAQQPAPQPNYAAALEGLRFRSIGPAIMGGRVDAFAVVESDPKIVYVGMASGGVWRTTNAGTTWEPLFDDQPVSTIGDIQVSPSDPSIVWVGTGEPNNRQSSSWGNGVYKSLDGGATWQHMGLEATHSIGKLQVHPANPNIVYVAAAGSLWGANRERGVYKTTDGGNTWTNVLFIDPDTGVVDIAMDPESPATLYAAAYQRRRTVFGFAGSGPGSALYKTTDGGATWKKLTKGLPYDPEFRERAPQQQQAGGGGFAAFQAQQAAAAQARAPRRDAETVGQTGRIGITIYRRNPSVVYVTVEHAQGGTFRSDDRGETWTKMSDTNPRPMYYSKLRVDPSNDLRIWVMGAPMYYSEDGGKTFTTQRVSRIHGDYHAMWINPADSSHMLVGSDGGIHWSWDAGRSWDFVNTVPLGQFYEVGVDMGNPYKICGGLQDNGSWCGPSRTPYNQGITNEDWFRVGGGDGFYVQIDPTDPNIVYAESQDGNLFRRDLRTSESKSIRPREETEDEPRYRFQWNSPVVISAHDPRTIYYAGQYLFRSTDRGDSWTRISPDLTTGAVRDKLEIMGRVPDEKTRSRHDGVQQWPAGTTLSESPLNKDVLWVGTDDGNLQVTRDGGRNWRNVADGVPGLPRGTYVTRVVASRHAEGAAYATFDGHRSNDFSIYVFATADFGQTWRAISSGIPRNNGVVNVIREHHRNPDLLFTGTEYGAYVSFDRGANWTPVKMGLPTVPVDDIAIHPRENDLIFGTHGRSVWVLDDITALEQMNAGVLARDLHVFGARPATAWRMTQHKGSTGHKMFRADNPDYGALITYYLKAKPAEGTRVRIAIEDAQGKTIREITPESVEAGVNRVAWNLRYGPPPGLTDEVRQGLGFLGGQLAQGPPAEPGSYTVKVSAGDQQGQTTVAVVEDPRIEISAEDRAARREAIMRVYNVAGSAFRAQATVNAIRTQLTEARRQWERPGSQVPAEIKQAGEELSKKVDALHGRFQNPPLPPGWAGPPLTPRPPTIGQRLGQAVGPLYGYTARPTAQQLAQIEALVKYIGETAAAVEALRGDVDALNKKMNEAGVPHIRVPALGRP